MARIIIMMVDLVEHHTGIVCVAHSLTSPETIFSMKEDATACLPYTRLCLLTGNNIPDAESLL